MGMTMFTYTRTAELSKKNRQLGIITVFLAVNLLFLVCQNDGAYTQDSGNITRRERVNLPVTRNLGYLGASQKNTGYYDVIVENNLFRPLGWTPPKRQPKYALIATLLESQGGTAKALLMENASKKTLYVTLGEKIGEMMVESIEARQVNLSISGEILTLKVPSIAFLNAGTLSSSANEQSTSTISKVTSRQTRRNQTIRNRGNLPSNVRTIVERYRQGTQADRMEIAEEMERRFGRQQKSR